MIYKSDKIKERDFVTVNQNVDIGYAIIQPGDKFMVIKELDDTQILITNIPSNNTEIRYKYRVHRKYLICTDYTREDAQKENNYLWDKFDKMCQANCKYHNVRYFEREESFCEKFEKAYSDFSANCYPDISCIKHFDDDFDKKYLKPFKSLIREEKLKRIIEDE